MPRRVIGIALVALTATARADEPAVTKPAEPAVAKPADELGDQGIAAEAGIMVGGRDTPGGLRIAGHYLYQLSDEDWFDGVANFTFGSGGAACFRDRADSFLCQHGITDGAGVEVVAAVRRIFAAQGSFRPFARAGIGLSYVRFNGDGVSGIGIPLHAGGGVRAAVAESIAIVAQADLALGIGALNHGLGVEPQLGFSVTAGAEFRLR